jgi:hypothetical protein
MVSNLITKEQFKSAKIATNNYVINDDISPDLALLLRKDDTIVIEDIIYKITEKIINLNDYTITLIIE